MTAGLPGTGIGGVFYLLSALLMPIIEIIMTLRGKSSLARWFIVLRQWVMGGIILLGMWLLGLIIGATYNFFVAAHPVVPNLVHNMHLHMVKTALHLNIFHIAPVVMSILTLTAILTLTHVMRLFIRPLADEA